MTVEQRAEGRAGALECPHEHIFWFLCAAKRHALRVICGVSPLSGLESILRLRIWPEI